jgi:excisionase family DNA binding protein
MTKKLSDFVSVAEAAALMSISAGRVRQLLRAGQLSGVKVGQRTWLVDRSSVSKRRLFGKSPQVSTAL